MDSFPVLPVSQAEAAREQQRRSAIFSGGHRFIWLSLNNIRRRTICGIEIINPMPYVDELAGNVTKYHLEVKGGETDFQFDSSRGVFRYAMLDSEHNRKFLASHYHLNFWAIEDDGVRSDIAARSKLIEEEIKGRNRPPAFQAPVEPKPAQESEVAGEPVEYEEYYDKSKKRMIKRRRPKNRGPKSKITPAIVAKRLAEARVEQQEPETQVETPAQPQVLPDPVFAGLPASDLVTPRGVGVVTP
jgi:hypothetical protein